MEKTASLAPNVPTMPGTSKVSDYTTKKLTAFTSTIIQSKTVTNSVNSIEDDTTTKSIIEGSDRYF